MRHVPSSLTKVTTHVVVHFRAILQHLGGCEHDRYIAKDENLHPKRLLLKRA